VNIKGFKIKDGVSPLSFETENIRAMILNKRKLKLIEDMEKQLYDEALKKGDAEIIIKYPKGLK
jgi:3-deoxy-D-manno-octulosonate 8-phosphate phosphatase KdsC-like HAD superfamily phosphatase